MVTYNITEVTRRDIFDLIQYGIWMDGRQIADITYHGRLSEIDFIKRIYNLKEIPSSDIRFKDAEGDIWQHTVNNQDWSEYWLFSDPRFDLSSGPDEVILKFLCEMFHPVVRIESEYWEEILSHLNILLGKDGYEIYEASQVSGRPLFGWKSLSINNPVINYQIGHVKQTLDSEYVNQQIDIMMSHIENTPNLAIGKAKELIETVCKSILSEKSIDYSLDLDVIGLMGRTCDALGLSPKSIEPTHSAHNISKRILGNLANIAQGMGELRNLYGDGHGKERTFKTLPPRYAQLAVGAAVVAVNFLLTTYREKSKNQTN